MKGQAVSLDAIVAMAIFGLIIASVVQAQNQLQASVRDADELQRMHQRTVELSDQLILTRGNPDSWHESAKINSIGLASSEHRLADAKLLKLALIGKNGSDDSLLRGNLSTGVSRVYVELLRGNANCTIGTTNISAGLRPANAREQSSIDRLVVVEDGRVCTLRVTLWRRRA